MTVLFVSDAAEDGHLMPVASELARRGVKVFVFNPGSFPQTASVTTESGPSGVRTHLVSNGETLDLAEVRSVWYRRPGKYELSTALLPEESEWLLSECNQFMQGVWANTGALWVSEPHQLRRANFKVLQMRLAGELGFRVPGFMVTNEPERARAFIDAHPEGVVVKTLGVPGLLVQGVGWGMVYTHLITADDVNDLETVRHGPTFLQAFVRKQRDIRVTVIGDALFAVGLESGHLPAAATDFRRVDTWDIPHAPHTLPEPVESACRTLVHRLGLRFGAIDLLQTSAGEYVFLEINPNGQWYWIEVMTGLPMASAMADLLERGLHGVASKPPPRTTRKPETLSVGGQIVPTTVPFADHWNPPGGNSKRDLAATRAWLERKPDGISLHVGDVDTDGAGD